MKQAFSSKHGGTARKLLPAFALLTGLSAPAYASGLFQGYMAGIPSSTLTKADWAAYKKAAQTLLNDKPAQPGQSEAWKGPNGESGTLTIEHVFEKSSMPCRDVNSVFNGKSGTAGKGYVLTVCKNSAGDWKIAS